jgi:opacity protein-like surface antigen
MKKFLVTATLAVALVSGAYASDVKVSSKIESAFKREFASAYNPRWESVGGGIYHAGFFLNGVLMEAYYNADGELLSFARHITRDQLPLIAEKSISDKFGTAEVKNIREFVSGSETSYFATVQTEKKTVEVRVFANGTVQILKKLKSVK